jgi:outer membrane lipoprotein-sorting protein
VTWSFSQLGAQQVPAQPANNAAGPVGAAAGPGSPAPEEPPTEAERAIDAAIAKIAKLESVAANVEQEVDMLNQKFKITGRYLKAPNIRIYNLLKISDGLPDSGGTFLQVCDGELLWEYEVVLDQPYYRKLKIKPILERLNSPDLDPDIRSKAMTQMGVAGPETLLIGLRRNLRFDIKEEAVLDGRKVWKFHGTWKTRQGLMFDSRQVNLTGVLPPYIPMDATLYLGVEDGWPYKLILEGRAASSMYDPRRIGPDGRPVGSKSSIEKIPRSKITLVYLDVKLNQPIRTDEFVFQAPANVSVSDDTESIVKTLDRALEVSAQKKKADALTKDGDILNQPIEVPAPGAQKNDSKPRE